MQQDMELENSIREIVKQEIRKQVGQANLQGIDAFCNAVGINRVTLWRREKEGKLKIYRIGKRCFVNPADFIR